VTPETLRNWIRNARSNPDVEIEIAGHRFAGRFRASDPAEHGRIRAAMARKYLAFRIASSHAMTPVHARARSTPPVATVTSTRPVTARRNRQLPRPCSSANAAHATWYGIVSSPGHAHISPVHPAARTSQGR